jgi:hypothetical protein
MLTHHFSGSGGTGINSTKKCIGACYFEHVFLHPVGSVGQSRSAFRCIRAQNVDILFFMLEWGQYRFHKKRTRTHYAELVFLHLVGSAGHVVHSVAS